MHRRAGEEYENISQMLLIIIIITVVSILLTRDGRTGYHLTDFVRRTAARDGGGPSLPRTGSFVGGRSIFLRGEIPLSNQTSSHTALVIEANRDFGLPLGVSPFFLLRPQVSSADISQIDF